VGVENCHFPLTKPVAVNTGSRYRAACDLTVWKHWRKHIALTAIGKMTYLHLPVLYPPEKLALLSLHQLSSVNVLM